jgi:hypothetical protein
MRVLEQILLVWLVTAGAVNDKVVTPYDVPFQIVRPSPDHKSMMIVKEGLAKLQEHDRTDISLLSVVGPYHSGKSFLLNSLLENMRAFIVGRHTTPETMGIWLCRTSLKGSDGSEVWLMDSEGFFGPGVDESYDAKVFTVASLLGSHLVYNTVKIIDQQAVNLLEILMTQAQLFESRSKVLSSKALPEWLSADTFPPLTWVVEDFVQELPPAFKKEGPVGYLTTYLKGSYSSGQSSFGNGLDYGDENVTLITKTFRDVRVQHLFLPATSKDQLTDLSRLNWTDLTAEYRSEIEVLRSHILSKIQARDIGGKKATGPKLAQALHFTVQALTKGMFQELPSLWTSWTRQVAETSLGDADQWFSLLLQEIDRDEVPVPVATFNERVEKAREQAARFYRHLIRDFRVNPQMSELKERMEKHFERKLGMYHEKTRRWVSEKLAYARDGFSKFLAKFTLPMHPDDLEKTGKSQLESFTKDLKSQLESFASSGLRVTLGRAAQMPTFTTAPATSLSNELRSQLSARTLENDREVDRIFKRATIAADEAVESELRGNVDSLIGKALMTKLFGNAESVCWRAFEAKLENYPWVEKIAKYEVAKAQVRKEAYEARTSRFSAVHEKRLSAHLHTGQQNALASYKEKANSVSMPVAQSDVELEHSKVATAAQDFLAEFAKGLTDTDAFKETSEQLAASMKEGLQLLQDKNVELWKVYSDGATRCAAKENNQRSRDCGILCLFSNVPWWHYRVSRKHLMQCFAKDSFGSRMSQQLQQQVFEAWYKKDMGHASSVVQRRMWMWIFSALAIAAAFWWYFRGRRQMYFYNYYPMQGSVYQPQMNQGVWRQPGTWASPGYGLRPDACYGQQAYAHQAAAPPYGPAVTQRRGLFGA